MGISFKINIDTENRGPGYWKLNTALLKDEMYKEKIKDLVYDTILYGKQHNLDSRSIWDLCKTKIRDVSILHSKSKVKTPKETPQVHFTHIQVKLCAYEAHNPDRRELFNCINAMSATEA